MFAAAPEKVGVGIGAAGLVDRQPTDARESVLHVFGVRGDRGAAPVGRPDDTNRTADTGEPGDRHAGPRGCGGARNAVG